VATPMKTGAHATGAPMKERKFPKEAYEYEAEVTQEAVARVKAKAAPVLEQDEWETIDGFALHG
jgi:hypothetical protein